VTPQEMLWWLPSTLGNGWNWIVAAMAAPACVLMLLWMVIGHDWTALLFARLVMLGSFVCFALAPLNSGWLPWGALLAAAGGLLTSVLIATNWCERTDKTVKMHTALGRWLAGLSGAALTWLCGPFKPWHPEDP
jgi:hypothetical protein